ncbi:MAG: replication-associated recombination protein A [Wenzhouxiangellaceae bacterium]|nr:replication-associated recombination protein A [Wenzhouxiangellaceae bacterium]
MSGKEPAPHPLADKLRPASFDDVVGQDHLLGPDGPLRRMVEAKRVLPLVFWGPPGSGKTTLARLLAGIGDLHFEQISAIFSGVADLKKIFARARERREQGQGTLLFVDEIHRFNRSQQDSFLPYVEDGTVVLVGATTENPSFELNGALLSRLKVLVLQRLSTEALERLIVRAERHIGRTLSLTEEARAMLVTLADGDGRYLINTIEAIVELADPGQPLDPKALMRLTQHRAVTHDRAGEAHYNLISALHKSMRASDADASLYWLARMFAGGEDVKYIIRRLVRFASEDVGLADPNALIQALAARDAYAQLGSPEGDLAIVQAVVYLATAPKSNALYAAERRARAAAARAGSLPPPPNILNAPTAMMKDLGYGRDYVYEHDRADAFSGQNCFPEGLPRENYYRPAPRGFERDVIRRLEYWERLRGGVKNTVDDPKSKTS